MIAPEKADVEKDSVAFNPGSTTGVKMTPSILSPHVLYEGDAPEMHGFLTFRDSQPQICCVC